MCRATRIQLSSIAFVGWLLLLPGSGSFDALGRIGQLGAGQLNAGALPSSPLFAQQTVSAQEFTQDNGAVEAQVLTDGGTQDAVAESPGPEPTGPLAEMPNESDMALPGEQTETSASQPLDMLSLLVKGGWLMVPLGVMSIAVVTVAFERTLALRRAKVMPAPLLEGLADLGGVPGVMDPRRAYRLCQQYPSSAAIVIRSMLLKIGRPQSEVEHAVAEASEREAERLYGSARWLNLIAAVAPLIGLLGTVWGMIRAFYDTTQLAAGQNKADFLAEGIYVALVTTLGGLVVAIPAAIFAHYFEGRVIKLFHEIDELLFSLLPQIERYEGRMRVTPHTLGGVDEPVGEGRSAVPDPAGLRGPAKAV